MVTSLIDWREKRRPASPLGELDWKVIETARADSALSLRPHGLVARIARDLFGYPVTLGLSDSKLEALRRFSVRAWNWDVIRAKDLHAFFTAGYSRVHLLEILSLVGLARGFTPSIEYGANPRASRPQFAQCRCG